MVKFGVLLGFTAIFLDASIASGGFRENNPYRSAWSTKTFLITTSFSLDTPSWLRGSGEDWP